MKRQLDSSLLTIVNLTAYNIFSDLIIYIHPFQLHALAFSVFASTIGPFGGFFASGFKRAFNIKDFGNTIPGHGGLVDRLDCIVIMITFVNAYIHSFIRVSSPNKLFNQLIALKYEDQMDFLKLIKNHYFNNINN